ncbi:unnamed protein product [Parascedosporium putredinis]|uniref:RBR-type E3 ubiquitin transferase n=1 Tax=Parascedosporium putredinis TaxID=1442378 RepID=A0A9P1HDE6_9PEZI|nr:unnamed protein product [Parascedosporium putredinis]CAI8003983.1 unnamed protein product [Parascedosporium putredinis]
MDTDEEYMSTMSTDDEVLIDDSGDEDFGDDFDDDAPDPDFGLSSKDLDKKKKAYETTHKVFEPSDIQRQQSEMIDEVNMICDIRKEDAAILLRHFRWQKERLLEDYMDRPKKVLEAVGLGRSSSNLPKLEIVPGFMCDICCEDGDDLQTFAMKCGHRFCVDCYRRYLTQKIKEEGEAARIQCPADGCPRILDSRSLDILVMPDLQGRYRELLNRTYVEDSDVLKWCPAPDCANAIECAVKKKDLSRIVPTVSCRCGHCFCFGCGLNDHQPAPVSW